jgi:Flp pilus assembly CpaF family ATPase
VSTKPAQLQLINENLVRDLAGGVFVAQQRNVVPVGGTSTGKTHLRSRLHGAVSAPDREAASSTLSISPTG